MVILWFNLKLNLYIHGCFLPWCEIRLNVGAKKNHNCVYGYMLFCSHGVKLTKC